jgi:hypothetical protein
MLWLFARAEFRATGFAPRGIVLSTFLFSDATLSFWRLLAGLSLRTPECLTLIFSYTFLLPEGQMGEDWEPSEKRCFFGNRGELNRKDLSLFFITTSAANFLLAKSGL